MLKHELQVVVDQSLQERIDLVKDPATKIFAVFYETINPQVNFKNKGGRDASLWLIKKYGLDVTIRAAVAAVKVQGIPYAPLITTPYQLKEKLAALQIFYIAQSAIINKKKVKLWRKDSTPSQSAAPTTKLVRKLPTISSKQITMTS